jgi:hypothetical protein
MAQSVLNDEDYSYDGDDTGRISPRRLSPLRGGDRFDSPDRALSRYVNFIYSRSWKREMCLFWTMYVGKKNIVFYFTSLLLRTFIFLVVNKKIFCQDEMSGFFE